ncbi:hypothetical protein ABW14_26170 [Klebsiella michiganensis]|nr:hypothetical protein ABW14_26170 [Klebsiella michiganensis]
MRTDFLIRYRIKCILQEHFFLFALGITGMWEAGIGDARLFLCRWLTTCRCRGFLHADPGFHGANGSDRTD